ncbi:hypothetical protein ACFQMM_24280 [Saliphagus sp. GCM10025308]
MSQDGTVDHLAVGSVPSGIGPTLAPGSVAMAVRADPAPDASPGDVVEVWSADGSDSRRLATADLRATAGTSLRSRSAKTTPPASNPIASSDS